MSVLHHHTLYKPLNVFRVLFKVHHAVVDKSFVDCKDELVLSPYKHVELHD